ncbi:MAG: restriction endonuclease subunit S [Candidatus Hydrothermae bacterium]|nr:restriction endonuclease subunit S [Candidatus Hydrothermae bacterium]
MKSKSIAIGGKFKPSPLGPIPKDWEVVRLGEVSKVIRGASPRPKGDPRYFSDIPTSYRWLKISDLSKYRQGMCLYDTEEYLTAEGMRKSVLVSEGTLLLTNSGTIGKPVITKVPVCIHDGFLALKDIHTQVQREFLYFLLEHFQKKLTIRAPRGTQANLNTSIVKSLPIPLPPLPEQKRIAEVLRTVDEAIEKVDREMEHTERLKRGLMQHLLTRGIGHTRFKDSPLGKIPETWEVVRLKELTLKMFGGGTPSTNKKEYWDGDIPWITSAHINGMYVQDGQRYISQEGVEHSSTNVVPAGNVIVATRVGIGKVAIAKIDVAISQDLTGIIVNRDRAIPEFLYWLLNYNRFGLKRFAQGSTIKGVLRSTIANMYLPLPPLPEQRKIAEILMTVDRKLELFRREKEHLQRLKKGLMDDLLTGRRRLRVEGA